MLSVVIITYNEEKNIGRCLESVREVADDVVVVDSFSTDKTKEICESFNVNFIQKDWEGYSETKNFANQQAKFDWIFSIDADESLSNELKESILEIKRQRYGDFFEISRLTNYCGSWIKHCGWYPDIKLRFFNRTSTQWQGIIHETLIPSENKKAFRLQGDLLHYSYYTIEDHIRQINKFTDIAALSLFQSGKKAKLLKLIYSPVVKFARDYFFKLGMLDGYAGLQISVLSSYATFLKYAKLRELNRNKN